MSELVCCRHHLVYCHGLDYVAAMVASMTWTSWCLSGLDYVFAYACFHKTPKGKYTRHLVTCDKLSQCVALARKARHVLGDSGKDLVSKRPSLPQL
jgi:hypothetical protein